MGTEDEWLSQGRILSSGFLMWLLWWAFVAGRFGGFKSIEEATYPVITACSNASLRRRGC